MTMYYEMMQLKELIKMIQGARHRYTALVPFIYESSMLLYAPDSTVSAIVPPDLDTSNLTPAGSSIDNAIIRLFKDRGRLQFRIRMLPGSDFYVTDMLVSPIVVSEHILFSELSVDVGYAKFHGVKNQAFADPNEWRDMYIRLREQTVYRIFHNTNLIMEFLPEASFRFGQQVYCFPNRTEAWRAWIHPIIHIPLPRPLKLEDTDEVVLEVEWPGQLLKPLPGFYPYNRPPQASLDGTVVAVPFGGDAYIFRNDGSIWKIEAFLRRTLPVGGPLMSDLSMSGDGNTIVAGFGGDAFNDATPATGYVVVWRRIGGEWRQVALINSPVSNNSFGFSVATNYDGSRIVVGAPNETVGGVSGAGRVYVYDGSGNLLYTLTRPTPITIDRFGFNVAMSRDPNTAGPNYIVVTVPGTVPSEVRVYDKNGTSIATLNVSNSAGFTIWGKGAAINDNDSNPVIVVSMYDPITQNKVARIFWGPPSFTSSFTLPGARVGTGLINLSVSVAGPQGNVIVVSEPARSNLPSGPGPSYIDVYVGSTASGTWSLVASLSDPVPSNAHFNAGVVYGSASNPYVIFSHRSSTDVFMEGFDFYVADSQSTPSAWSLVQDIPKSSNLNPTETVSVIQQRFQIIGIQLRGIRAFYVPTSYEDISLFTHDDLVGSVEPITSIPSVRVSQAPGDAWVSFVDAVDLPDFDPDYARRITYAARDELIVYALPVLPMTADMSVGGLMLFYAPKTDLFGRIVLDQCLLIPAPSHLPALNVAWQASLGPGTDVRDVLRHLSYTDGTPTSTYADDWVFPIPLKFRRNYLLTIKQLRDPFALTPETYSYRIVGLRRVEP